MNRRLASQERWTVPNLVVRSLADRSPNAPVGFLRLVRRELQLTYPDGQTSEVFEYDEITRRALDAVVIAAYFTQAEKIWVYLRSAMRPPLAFRRCAAADTFGSGVTWELPAGLIEPEEEGATGVVQAASRELKEELGFIAEPSSFQSLGQAILPCPALVAEQQYFVRLQVDPSQRQSPTLDGSPLEQFGKVIAVPLDEALLECRKGLIADAKTELGLRRLWDVTQEGSP